MAGYLESASIFPGNDIEMAGGDCSLALMSRSVMAGAQPISGQTAGRLSPGFYPIGRPGCMLLKREGKLNVFIY